MAYINLSELEAREVMPGFMGKFSHGTTMTASFWEIKKGSVLPRHSHIHEQISIVTAGTFEMTLGEEKKVLEPGMVAMIPSNMEHEGIALTDCTIMDVFCPVREDYR